MVRTEVMQFLIQSVWIRQEAAELGIEVSLARVLRSFERQKRKRRSRVSASSGSSSADPP